MYPISQPISIAIVLVALAIYFYFGDHGGDE